MLSVIEMAGLMWTKAALGYPWYTEAVGGLTQGGKN